MKNFLTIAFVVIAFTAKAQLAVTAPSLELLTNSNIAVQQKSLVENMQNQINTLNTSRNTLESLDKIKEIDKRITQVNAKLKQARVVYNIFNVGGQVLKNATSTAQLISNNRPKNIGKIPADYLNQIQVSVDEADNIVAVCKDILSENYVMNDFERLTLLNNYFDKINNANSKIKNLFTSYNNILAINKL